MKQKYQTKTVFKALLIAVISCCTMGVSLADYEIKKFTINNGAQTMNSARYDLQASVAQVDANQSTNNEEIKISSGFWQQNTDLIFKDNLE